MMIIAVFNQKGGVGKTTTCLNLAAGLARKGFNPLVLDLDPQANLTISLGCTNLPVEKTIASFFLDKKPLDPLILKLDDGIRLIPAHFELSKVDTLYGKTPHIAKRLKEGLLEDALIGPDPVLIDCCPMLGVLSLNALFASKWLLLPVSADYLSFMGANRLDRAVAVIENALGRSIRKHVLLTRYDARRRFSQQIGQQLQERYGDRLCKTIIRENVSLAEAPLYAKDIFSYAPHSSGAKDYGDLTEELLQRGIIEEALQAS
ncbi:MAG: ParA family protein [Proteobacteria bacterium]|nr:ParA family protein [Pseudomonadota bacterium]MDE3209049.1 ParA family protein [Pseudomonadota bacterium]